MGQSYEFDGEQFDSVEEFIQALAHAYKEGDKELALSTLDEYGFSLSDLGVRPHEGPSHNTREGHDQAA